MSSRESLLTTFPTDTILPEVKSAIGNKLYLDDDTVLVDYSGGITGHNTIGWGQTSVAEAAYQQAMRIGHIDYKNFLHAERTELANLLCNLSESNLSSLYLVGGSGGEACEAAMKLSYQTHCHEGNSGKIHYISRKQSYHGSTSDTLSLGDRPNLSFYSPFHPHHRSQAPEHNIYRHLRSNETTQQYMERSINELEAHFNSVGPENIGGFVAETIMGGLVGDVPAVPGYWKGVRDLCDKYNIHLILDEVWCGCGVSGKYYAHDHESITPDFVFFGKTLASGYAPISALMVSERIHHVLKDIQIQHSTTFQGHALTTAIALQVVRLIIQNNWVQNAAVLETQIHRFLDDQLNESIYLENVRGRGIRVSLEHNAPDQHLFSVELSNRLRQSGYLVSGKWHRLSFSALLSSSFLDVKVFLKTLCEHWLSLEEEWQQLDKNSVRLSCYF